MKIEECKQARECFRWKKNTCLKAIFDEGIGQSSFSFVPRDPRHIKDVPDSLLAGVSNAAAYAYARRCLNQGVRAQEAAREAPSGSSAAKMAEANPYALPVDGSGNSTSA